MSLFINKKTFKRLIVSAIFLLSIITFSSTKSYSQGILTRDTHYWYQVSIGKQYNFPTDSTAWLEIGNDSTTKGLILPRVLDTSSIVNASKGNIIFRDLDSNIYYNTGNMWKKLNTTNLTFQKINDSVIVINSDTIRFLLHIPDTLSYNLYAGYGLTGSPFNGKTSSTFIVDSSKFTTISYVNSQGFLKSYTETDPIALNKSVTNNQGSGILITGTATQLLSANPNWIFKADTSLLGTKYYINSQGFLKSYTETDPIAINKTVSIIGGTGMAVSGVSQILNNNPTFTINAQTTSALWNANELQGVGVSTNAPQVGQSLVYNGTVWYPTTITSGGSGSVTSVGLTMPSSLFLVSNTPVTSTGTFNVTFNNQAQGTVFAAPTSGSGQPSFRSLTATDIPVLNYAPISASTSYIWNGTTQQTANYNISGNGVIGGNLTVTGTVTTSGAFESSDKRLKNIIGYGSPFIIDEVSPVMFTWKSEKYHYPFHYGYIAQDIEKVLPSVVKKDSKGYMSVNYTELHTVEISNLYSLIQKQQKEIDMLKEEIKLLQTK